MINAIRKRYYYKAAVAAEMKRPQQPEETPAPQQLAEMRQLPVPARLERPILLLPWAQIS